MKWESSLFVSVSEDLGTEGQQAIYLAFLLPALQ